MWIVTLLIFIFILGIIVLVHELGHFLWARHFGVHIYEFSIGMGPVIYTKVSKKDGIKYNIRALPIGGFVAMAGEVYEDDKEVPKDKCLCNKPIWQRIIVMAAGVMNNFILAILLLFITFLIWGSTTSSNKIAIVEKNSVFDLAGIKEGDKIIAIDGKKVYSMYQIQTRLAFKSKDGSYTFTIADANGKTKDYKLKKECLKDDEGNCVKQDGEDVMMYGFNTNALEKGFFNALKNAFIKFGDLIYTMLITLGNLITGHLSIDNLSGPVGIYEAVGSNVVGFSFTDVIYNVLSLISLLSINVGLVNILPFPAFDGGHILFLIIEKIKGSPVNQKFENLCHTIGFILLMLLIVVVTFNDIIRFF